MHVTCTDCQYSRVISPDDPILLADLIIEHGRETGHTLAAERVDE